MTAENPLIAVAVGLVLAAVLIHLMGRAIRRIGADRAPPAPPVILDGSNILYWDGGTPRLETVQSVVEALIRKGYAPGVVFDANAGYLLFGSYKHDGALSRKLGLAVDRVKVVPKGMPADPAILQAARDMDAPVVTNDRFRDWADQFPEVRRDGHLVRGSCKSGQVRLRLPAHPESPGAATSGGKAA